MTLPSTDHSYLQNVTPDRLAALILELASQLHVERQRRIALEAVLERQGILPAGALDGVADDASVLEKGRAELDQAMRHLLRIVTETGDPRAPLRAEHI